LPIDAYYRSYLQVAAVGLLGLGLFGAMIGLAKVLQPRRLSDLKSSIYECGVEPLGDEWSQSQVRYYVFALLFVVFDVEAIFVFPWAVIMGTLSWAALVEMVIFILILAVALLYAVRKGVLRWI